jgi:hypothetical protein
MTADDPPGWPVTPSGEVEDSSAWIRRWYGTLETKRIGGGRLSFQKMTHTAQRKTQTTAEENNFSLFSART